ncbi:MAG: hypothetical protein IKS71_06050 [Bacteroidales bacterium]|nr:hypothetical protein [Bacteroidales bacterium]
MRKYLWIIVLVLAGCTPRVQPAPDPDPDPVPEPEDKTLIVDRDAISQMWKRAFGDAATISSLEDITSVRWSVDGNYKNTFRTGWRTTSADLRYEFYSDAYLRFVSESDGYALSIPLDLNPVPDYTLAKYAQKFSSERFSLRVTLEQVTPYTPNEHYYGVYTGEWLDRYIANQTYINQNDLRYLSEVVRNDETIIEGCSVNIYSIDAQGLARPYYKIALVRPLGQWSKFGFLLYKCSSQEDLAAFDGILKSFKVIDTYGRSKNFLPAQEARPNPKWNDETKAYYQKLLTQKTLDFGVFSGSMVQSNSDSYSRNHALISSEKERLEAAFAHNYEIMPTYSHIAWYTSVHYFPTEMAEEFAGGNGFNGKPVLQFSYQYTTNNNNVNPSNTTNCSTPMFDILRGNYDEVLRDLAVKIKAYGHPVLFRLNNEMNSDWTSYCGMMTLCDPDIFIDTWKYLYDMFEAEGVDNCIWIFNPIAVSCPYSNWSEDLAYYPGNDYVQILGLTAYESGNSLPLTSFRDHYVKLYNKNSECFSSMPWVISEFGCGAGGAASGEEKRNAAQQAAWVRAMFADFQLRSSYPYLQPIKGAVWFSANDYSGNQTTNYFELSADLTETLQAFRDGFAQMYPNE